MLGKHVLKATPQDIPKDAYHNIVIPMKIKDKAHLGYNHAVFGKCSIHLSIIRTGVPLQLSIINGVEVNDNPFLTRALQKIFDAIKTQVADSTKIEFKKGMFNKNIVAIFIGTIMNPQWVGQT